MRLVFAIMTLCFAACTWAQPQGSIERGGKLYQEKWFPYEAFVMQTRRPRASMPRYPVEVLSDQEMADIYAYAASIEPGPAAKDLPLLRD